jgi:hypothetical protein
MEVKHYKSSVELNDGRTLTLKYSSIFYGTSHPENDSSDSFYYIDGVPVDREDLPEELTAAVLAELEANAVLDCSPVDGGPDYDDSDSAAYSR